MKILFAAAREPNVAHSRPARLLSATAYRQLDAIDVAIRNDHKLSTKLFFDWTVARALQRLPVSSCMMLIWHDSVAALCH